MAKVVKCYVCRHPNRKKIDEALRAGMTQAEVQRTLCPDVKKHSVQRHFRMDHHLEELGPDWTPGTIPTITTKRTRTTASVGKTRGTVSGSGDTIKVHWELPRDLVKKLKHRAIDDDVPTVELVRDILNRGL